MVDVADLAQVNALYAEAASIDQAFVNFVRLGTIMNMTIGAWPPEGEVPEDAPASSGNVVVDTTHINYPPQMLQGIKDQLSARRAQINTWLEELGVTGLGPEPAPLAAAAPAAAGQRPRPGQR